MAEHFDLVVIGGGPAGICGANAAAIFGKRVALVEKLPDIGGAGINTGTIPSKTLRETALALSGLRSRKLFGVDLSLRRGATVADLMHHKDDVVRQERERREEQFRLYKVERFQGNASFVDPHTVRVAPDTVLREKILIATGSSPVHPPNFHLSIHASTIRRNLTITTPQNAGRGWRGRNRASMPALCCTRGRSVSDRRTCVAPQFSRSRDF
jgi:NAD(P) transhydrogenase